MILSSQQKPNFNDRIDLRVVYNHIISILDDTQHNISKRDCINCFLSFYMCTGNPNPVIVQAVGGIWLDYNFKQYD